MKSKIESRTEVPITTTVIRKADSYDIYYHVVLEGGLFTFKGMGEGTRLGYAFEQAYEDLMNKIAASALGK